MLAAYASQNSTFRNFHAILITRGGQQGIKKHEIKNSLLPVQNRFRKKNDACNQHKGKQIGMQSLF